MQLDPTNQVVQLCHQGIMAETAEEALEYFEKAWENAGNDLEACISAHYIAKHQTNPADELRWNLEAANRADAVGEDKAGDYLPSLYLNLAFSYEKSGDYDQANQYYLLASEKVSKLSESGYKNWVSTGIKAGMKRINP